MQQHCFEYGDACSTMIQQTMDIALPMALVPTIDVGDIKIMCCGEPHVECCNGCCCCDGLSLKITQTVTYKIPIEYRAKAITGDVTSECKKNSPTGGCTQCRN